MMILNQRRLEQQKNMDDNNIPQKNKGKYFLLL